MFTFVEMRDKQHLELEYAEIIAKLTSSVCPTTVGSGRARHGLGDYAPKNVA